MSRLLCCLTKSLTLTFYSPFVLSFGWGKTLTHFAYHWPVLYIVKFLSSADQVQVHGKIWWHHKLLLPVQPWEWYFYIFTAVTIVVNVCLHSDFICFYDIDETCSWFTLKLGLRTIDFSHATQSAMFHSLSHWFLRPIPLITLQLSTAGSIATILLFWHVVVVVKCDSNIVLATPLDVYAGCMLPCILSGYSWV